MCVYRFGSKKPDYAMWNAGEEFVIPVPSLVIRSANTLLLSCSAPFLAVARAFSDVQQGRSKLRHQEIMRELFLSIAVLSPKDLVTCIYLATNRLGPAYEGLELGIGDSIVMKAIVEATGKSMKTLKEEYTKVGDLGLIAQSSTNTVRTLKAPKPLTVHGLFESLLQIAKMTGHDVMKKKQDKIRHLLVCCRESEAQFVIKMLQGKMRINLGPKSVVAGLSHAYAYAELGNKNPGDERLKKAVQLVNAAFSQLPSWEKVITALNSYGLDELPHHCKLTIGIPVEPMLAQPTKGTKEILERLQGHEIFTAEYKYDGERAQVHRLEDGTTKIYSRNLEDNTGKFPDIIGYLPNAMKETVKSFILDCEAVAFDRETQKILPFQILSTRARKEVSMENIKVNVCLFVFDLLYLNGEPVIHKTLQERRILLQEHFKHVSGEFHFATAKEFSDTDEMELFLGEAVENQCEGLMVKSFVTDAAYVPAKRSYQWLKLKKDYMDGITDTVDLVPIAAWHGKGKRTGVYGAFLMAVYDDENEEYQSVCKIGTGLSDAQLIEHSQTLVKHLVPSIRQYYRTGDSLKPDVWFDPSAVWEVLAADLSISPVHKAAVGDVHDSKGIALRFPRFLKIRDDKSPENATTAKQIAQMYRSQKITHSSKKNADEEDDD